jgi:hypothetical protein
LCNARPNRRGGRPSAPATEPGGFPGLSLCWEGRGQARVKPGHDAIGDALSGWYRASAAAGYFAAPDTLLT